MQATQRATAKALGVSHVTVNNDIKEAVNKLTNQENKYSQGKELKNSIVNNLTKPYEKPVFDKCQKGR
jgi:predicted DNA-binding protein YlxM (UPF0122 family)